VRGTLVGELVRFGFKSAGNWFRYLALLSQGFVSRGVREKKKQYW
jgi:hypothetical protein